MGKTIGYSKSLTVYLEISNFDELRKALRIVIPDEGSREARGEKSVAKVVSSYKFGVSVGAAPVSAQLLQMSPAKLGRHRGLPLL